MEFIAPSLKPRGLMCTIKTQRMRQPHVMGVSSFHSGGKASLHDTLYFIWLIKREVVTCIHPSSCGGAQYKFCYL